jgi:uncharacterized protein (TIGR00369 family)
MSASEPVSHALERRLADSPFQQLLGLRLQAVDLALQSVTIRAVYGSNVERSTGTGQYHGGVIASLIDIAGDFALIAVLGYGVPTINFRVDYLRPAAHSDLIAEARVRRAGRTIGVVDIDVTGADGRPRPPLSLGYPLADISCKLVDGPSDDDGILALRTRALLSGYLNLPAATASRMRDGWYLTGDVMRRDANGFYFFVGRADDMFVCGGENIYPGEIEKMLERHSAVAQVIVVAAPHEIKGQIPIAFVVPRPGTTPTAAEVKEYAIANGPAYAHPRFVEFVERLPVAGTEKIDRTALTAEAARIVRESGRCR